MLRGRSKDRTRKFTPPGPVYMSSNEFADYLKDLRTNRVARPTGARPQPTSSRRESSQDIAQFAPVTESQSESKPLEHLRSASVQSHRRTHSSLSNYSSVTSRTGRQLIQQPQKLDADSFKPLKASDVVPTAIYMERGQRWMEKEEAGSLRDALEDMDLRSKQTDEDTRIHVAAQNEASELVFQHQNPGMIPEPGAPYRYRDHLRKNSYQHARSASIGRRKDGGTFSGPVRGMGSRTVSGSSIASTEAPSYLGRMSLESQHATNYDAIDPEPVPGFRPSRKSYGSITGSSRSSSARRRSSAKRNASGEMAGAFTGEQIWEEPEAETERGRSTGTVADLPVPLQIKPKNPLNRVQFARDFDSRSNSMPPSSTKKISSFEIHKNPPTQSRNPNYTANTVPTPILGQDVLDTESQGTRTPMKDGLEIRSDEIRQATSMLLKDRSPKLPTPTVVSDRPGRPIVSFDSDWKPKGADEKPEVRRKSPFDRFHDKRQRQEVDPRPLTKVIAASVPVPNVSGPPESQIVSPDIPIVSIQNCRLSNPTIGVSGPAPTVPTISVSPTNFEIPHINKPDSSPCIPTINVTGSTAPLPTINISGFTTPVPTICLPSGPIISVSAPSGFKRPLPDPKAANKRTTQRLVPVDQGHWSSAGKRATATCHQCQLPIEGRVVKLGGSPENFHPQCFICFSCGTSLESLEIRPEPDVRRRERVDRIKRRDQGEELPEVEGETMAEDGDARLRFYCHLDWHEHFAPRCKHCTTPIMEEHMIALGQHWHYGHFFCAECGDPFQKGQSHIEKDGYAWCISCQTKRTERRAPKCKKCKQPVIGEYVQALGGEWHDKCFRCAACHGGFDDGAFFPKIVGTETVVLCIGCIEMELKA